MWNPRNWSAKAQMALAAVLTAVIVGTLTAMNEKWGLNLTKETIGLIGATGVGAVLGIAHIDNGETGPNNPQEPAVPAVDPPEVTAAKRTLAAHDPALAARLGLVLVLGLTLMACSTGIGRAASLAVSGVPPEVPAALDGIEDDYRLRASYVMADIVGSDPQTEAGKIAKESAKADMQARVDAVTGLIEDVRTYLGVSKGSPNATRAAAQAKWAEALKAALTHAFPAPPPPPPPPMPVKVVP